MHKPSAPEQILEKWLHAVNNGAMHEVVSLYCDYATLLPTFSNEQLRGLDDLEKYFGRLAEYQGLQVILQENTLSVQIVFDNIYCLTGYYCWQFEGEGAPRDCVARFTFIVDISSASPIIHHHSSQLPDC